MVLANFHDCSQVHFAFSGKYACLSVLLCSVSIQRFIKETWNEEQKDACQANEVSDDAFVLQSMRYFLSPRERISKNSPAF